MTMRRRLARSGWTAAATALLVAGCADSGAALESAPQTTLVPVGAALHDPVFSYRRHSLIALTADHRVAEVRDPAAPDASRTRLSAPLDTGRNLQISSVDDGVVFVPQPHRGNVAVVDLASLHSRGEFGAGPAPAYLSENAGLRTLLALSEDGASVTPVDQYGLRALPTMRVSGMPAEKVDGANRGRAIDYHLFGPAGIGYYKGTSSPPTEHGSLAMDVAAAAGDGTKVTRSYVAGRDGATVYAVDAGRGGDGLEVIGQAVLPSSPVRYLGTDDTRIYAATDRDLVVLETASFVGYPDGSIPVLRVIGYRSGLPADVASAPLSGMAIGPQRVYLTLAGKQQLVSVAKPRL